MGKFTFLLGVAIGFVVGSAAGRRRYEQLKDAAANVVNKPQVQKVVQKVDDVIADKAPAVHEISGAVIDAVSPETKEATA